MSYRAFLSIVGAGLLLPGCANLTEPDKQTVSVQTIENGQMASSIGCQLVNDQGQWIVIAPGKAEVLTSAQDLVVTCTKPDGVKGTANVVARPTPGYLTQKTSAVVVPVGAPSAIRQVAVGVDQTYPTDIVVYMNEEVVVTANAN